MAGVKEIYKMGLKHGFKLAAIRGHKGVITDQEIALVRAKAEESRARLALKVAEEDEVTAEIAAKPRTKKPRVTKPITEKVLEEKTSKAAKASKTTKTEKVAKTTKARKPKEVVEAVEVVKAVEAIETIETIETVELVKAIEVVEAENKATKPKRVTRKKKVAEEVAVEALVIENETSQDLEANAATN